MSGRPRRRATPKAEPAYVPGTLLNWNDSKHWDYSGPQPCRYCGTPTQLLDGSRRHAHKVCAEAALARRHAEAAEAYDAEHHSTPARKDNP